MQPFYSVESVFDVQKFFMFMKSNLSVFSFVVCALGVLSKRLLPILMGETWLLFSSKTYIVLVHMFKVLIHLELVFVNEVR